MTHRLARQFGFSLVELLIAMTLGLILVTGMIAVFSGNKRTGEMTSEMANMQESARYALQTISEDLRSAGYQGCLGLDQGQTEDITDEEVLKNTRFFDTAATGSVVVDSNNWVPAPVLEYDIPASPQAVPGTHTISMLGGNRNKAPLVVPMQDGAGRADPTVDLIVGGNLRAGVGSPVIISDCATSRLFTVTDIMPVGLNWAVSHGVSGNKTGTLDQAFGTNGTLGQVSVIPFFSNIYFIGDTGTQTENGDPVTALYQQSYPFDPITNPPTELMQGIENMRVSFGIQDRTGQVQYVTADDPAFIPGRVASVQIGLLMTSWDRIATQDDNNTYVLAGQPIPAASNSIDGNTHAADRRYRLAFNTTVKVRNRRVQTQ
jgi:type IV pilus assembly protein PilW